MVARLPQADKGSRAGSGARRGAKQQGLGPRGSCEPDRVYEWLCGAAHALLVAVGKGW